MSNAAASAAQVVVSALVLFILYRFLLERLGADQIGIWALVAATTTLARVGEVGVAASLTKHVANREAQGDHATSDALLHTAVLLVAVTLGLTLAVATPIMAAALPVIVPAEGVPAAAEILPFSLLLIWVSGVGGVYLGTLDGRSRLDLRAAIQVTASFTLLGCAMLLVPSVGLRGVVYAQLAQAVVLLGLGVLANAKLRARGAGEVSMDLRARMRLLLGYGLGFQAISLAVFFMDPLTKALLGRFGGLTSVGYFEMATKLVLQVRNLVVASNQAVVPHVARLQHLAPNRITTLYTTSVKWVLFLTVPIFGAIAGFAPVLSRAWLGWVEQDFVAFVCILSVATAINVLSGPAYFSNLGEGRLKRNLQAHVLMAALNAAASAALGYWLGSVGVVAGYAVAQAVGSVLVILAFHADKGLRFREVFDIEDAWIAAGCLGGAVVAIWTFQKWLGLQGWPVLAALALTAFAAVAIVPMWRHSCAVFLRSAVMRLRGGG